MPVQADFSMSKLEDGVLQINMTPAVPIGGWSILFQVVKRFGGTSGLIVKSAASGFNGTSGITVTNSGNGVFNVNIWSADTSGLQFGNYVYNATRTNSGFNTVLSEGVFLLSPNT